MEVRTRTKVELLIEAGVYAGAYAALARELPDAKAGLIRLSLKHHERGEALMAEIANGAARVPGVASLRISREG